MKPTALPFIVFSLLLCPLAASADLPAAEDIADQAAMTSRIIADYAEKTLPIRLRYAYSGGFLLEEDRAVLRTEAVQAVAALEHLLNRQRKMRTQIEEYEGADWDARFGVTGLWRQLYADEAAATLNRLRMRCDLAMAVAESERDSIVEELLAELAEPDATLAPRQKKLLEALTLRLAADAASREKSLSRTQELLEESRDKGADAVFFRAYLLRVELLGRTTREDLYKLYSLLEKSPAAEDVELNLRTAFMELRLESPPTSVILEQVTDRLEATRGFAAEVILTDLQQRFDAGELAAALANKSDFEVRLAGRLVLSQEPAEHADLFAAIARQPRFATALMYYVLAEASARTDPKQALEYLHQAAAAQRRKADPAVKLTAEQIALEAARRAWRLYVEDAQTLATALETAEWYRRFANGRMDEAMEYARAILLGDAGRTMEATAALNLIAQDGGRFAPAAKLDLLAQRARNENLTEAQRDQILRQLRPLTQAPAVALQGDTEGRLAIDVRQAATILMCQLLLRKNEPDAAQQVIAITAESLDEQDPERAVLRGKAFRLVGRLVDAAEEMVPHVETEDLAVVAEMEAVVLALLERPEEILSRVHTPAPFLENCALLARRCLREAPEPNQPGWRLAVLEIQAMAAPEPASVAPLRTQLQQLAGQGRAETLDYLRCHARLLQAAGEYESAARTWGRIAAVIAFGENSGPQSSYAWWQAKYHQLACWSRLPDASAAQVRHAVEVLVGTMPDIPAFWRGKLEQLH